MTNYFDEIERYLRKKMSEEETSDFENKIRKDSALKKEVEHQRFELETIDLMEEDILRENFNKYESEIPNDDNSSSFFYLNKKLFWTSIILIGVISIIIGLTFLGRIGSAPKNGNEEINIGKEESISNPEEFQNEINTPPNSIDTNGLIDKVKDKILDKDKSTNDSSQPDGDTLKLALADPFLISPHTVEYFKGSNSMILIKELYNTKEYDNLINLVDSLLNDPNPLDFDHTEVLFLRGLSFLYSGNYLSAEKDFSKVLESSQEQFHDKARWFLALSYLKSGQFQIAENTLEEIVQLPGRQFQKSNARILSSQLNSID